MQRILEVIASIPNLIVVILFVLIFEPSIWTIILAMSITGWLGMSRVVRGEFLKLKNQDCHGFENIGGFKIQIDI